MKITFRDPVFRHRHEWPGAVLLRPSKFSGLMPGEVPAILAQGEPVVPLKQAACGVTYTITLPDIRYVRAFGLSIKETKDRMIRLMKITGPR